MERSRKLEFLPILSIESNHPTKQSNNKYVLQIIAYNIGKGIAQNPKIIVPLQKAQNIRTLGLQETDGKCFEISDIDMKAIPLLPNNKRCIEIKYNDIFNKEIVTRALITEIDPVFRVDN
jgi:hypothetical protein